MSKDRALPVLSKLISNRKYSVAAAYEDSVQAAYEHRDILTRAQNLSEKLGKIERKSQLEPDLLIALEHLSNELERVLGS